MSFFETYFLWKEAVAASVLLAAGLSIVGTYAVLQRVAFLPATLSQLSGAGVMFAFFLTLHIPLLAKLKMFPLTLGILFALLGTVIVGRQKREFGVSRESAIGVGYILSSAAIILFSNALPQESHHVDDLLFGNAILVDSFHLVLALAGFSFVATLHVRLKDRFMFVSFDQETAEAHGLPVARINMWLYFSMALMITLSTKIIGALPAFAFAVIPPWFCIQIFNSSAKIVVAAAIASSVSAFLGYWLSFVLDTPTGATTTSLLLVCGVFCLFIAKAFQGRIHNRSNSSPQRNS